MSDLVREVRVPELRGADALLLLFHPPAALEGEPYRPLEIFVRNRLESVGVEELEQTAYGLLDGGGVAATEGAAEPDTAMQGRDPALGS